MIKPLFLASCALLLSTPGRADDPTVRVEPPQLNGSRPLEAQTATSVVRDYVQSWKTLQQALDQNDAARLERDFVGAAKDRFTATIQAQAKSGIHTNYTDRSHDLRIIFYSPEGLSIQMTDDVEYVQQVSTKDKVLATKTVHEHYLVVMTPSETRWQVRILQADPS